MNLLPIDALTRAELESVKRVAQRTGTDLFEALNKVNLILTNERSCVLRSNAVRQASQVVACTSGHDLLGNAYAAGSHTVLDIRQAVARRLDEVAAEMRLGLR